MVLCIVVSCGSKSSKHKVTFSKIPKIVTNQGEEWEELTRERRNRWISAVSRGDAETKNILESERVCSRHFVSGKPAATWDKYNIDWAPTLNLGEKEYKENERKEQQKAAEGRAERAKERRKRAIEQQEVEVAEKGKHLNLSGDRVADIHFTETSTSTSTEEVEEYASSAETTEVEPTEPSGGTIIATSDAETQTKESIVGPTKDAETQSEGFDYMFYKQKYQAPDRKCFSSDDKVRFYTALPSYQVLVATLNHVVPHVSQRTQTLDPFQEFVMVLIKLRLNLPFQDMAFPFLVSVLAVSRIFWSWITAMDYRLRLLVHWPERENLWKTMPMCFKYSFGNKVTVVIDCFDVFY